MEKVNVVIVDDNLHIVSTLASAFEREDIILHPTTSSNKALEICLGNNIDIALIDVNMPELNGFDLLSTLKKNPITEHIMVILITGQILDVQGMLNGLLAGAIDYITKPLDLHIITAKINSLVTTAIHQKQIDEKNKELKLYQEQLISLIEVANKSKHAKENFLANMSHEIRTPLNAIIGLTYVLKDSVLTKDQRGIVKLIEYSSNSLLGIVNDVLDISKIDAGNFRIKKEEIEISKLIDNICESTRPMAVSKGLSLNCDIHESVPKLILADSLRLNQILINLINNAIKFTSIGEVMLKVSVADTLNDKSQLRFDVIDTGMGIPQEKLDKIFSRFEQLENLNKDSFGGTGLGLAIVKKLAELKGGEVMVESKIGEGSKFTFKNWYEHSGRASIGSSTQSTIGLEPLTGKRVLVVDDDPINRLVTQRILSGWDIAVDTAEDGAQGIAMIKANKYDVILMDMHMPVMNGVQATKKIRTEISDEKCNVPIISYSSSVVDKEQQDARAAGVNDFVLKPFKPEELHLKLKLLTQISRSL